MEDIGERLRSEFGDRVRSDVASTRAFARDRWVLSELDHLEGRPPPPPAAVVTPRAPEEVSALLAFCRRKKVPVVTYGGGSGVCGAIRTAADTVVLSTRGLDGVVGLSPEDMAAGFRAGTNGMEAERAVQREGFTIGHWPQSIELSTVGGWVATRASGQYSTAYGNIEDLLLDLEAVLPDGRVLRTRRTPRAAAGPDLRQLFLGSEGTLGVVTEVTLSLRPLPEASRGQAFHFASFAEGLVALRRLIHAGWRPPVTRLYDPAETARHFQGACPEGRAALILLHEGPVAGVEAERAAVAALCAEAGGGDADPGAVDHWLAERNRVPDFGELLSAGVIFDTIEVACTWGRAAGLYTAVLAALRGVPSLVLASAHSSHSYRSGTNLYITFAARPDRREEMPAVYRECWRRTLEVTLAEGGGIAHHHGIGRVRRDFLAREIGDAGVALLRAIKASLDPDGLLNPGVLLPD